jgi:hypothetical protein
VLRAVFHLPKLCSSLSTITFATAVTNTGMWWNLYPPNTTFGRFLYPGPAVPSQPKAFGVGLHKEPMDPLELVWSEK